MDLALADKVVFISGASGGIGRAVAEVFAAEGARLVLHGNRNWGELQDWLADQPWKDMAMAVQADIADPLAVEAVFESVRKRWGRIDICIANAGIWPPQSADLVDLDEDRIRSVMEINLFGAIWTARAFLRQLRECGPRADDHGACLLFTGSTAGRFGERGHCDYAASKAALVGLMLSLKNEIVALDPCGRVNVIEPGWTVTEMTKGSIHQPGALEKAVRTMPLRQLARAEDIARAVVFVASPVAARHLTGQCVTVAGGMEGRVLWEEGQVDVGEVLRRMN